MTCRIATQQCLSAISTIYCSSTTVWNFYFSLKGKRDAVDTFAGETRVFIFSVGWARCCIQIPLESCPLSCPMLSLFFWTNSFWWNDDRCQSVREVRLGLMWWRAEPGSSLQMCPSFHCNIWRIQIKLVIPKEQFITLVGCLIENQDGESIMECGITPRPLSDLCVCVCACPFARFSGEGFAWTHKPPE